MDMKLRCPLFHQEQIRIHRELRLGKGSLEQSCRQPHSEWLVFEWITLFDCITFLATSCYN